MCQNLALTGLCVPESGRDWLMCATFAGGEQSGGGGARVDARAEDAAHVYTEQARAEFDRLMCADWLMCAEFDWLIRV